MKLTMIPIVIAMADDDCGCIGFVVLVVTVVVVVPISLQFTSWIHRVRILTLWIAHEMHMTLQSLVLYTLNIIYLLNCY